MVLKKSLAPIVCYYSCHHQQRKSKLSMQTCSVIAFTATPVNLSDPMCSKHVSKSGNGLRLSRTCSVLKTEMMLEPNLVRSLCLPNFAKRGLPPTPLIAKNIWRYFARAFPNTSSAALETTALSIQNKTAYLTLLSAKNREKTPSPFLSAAQRSTLAHKLIRAPTFAAS